MNSKGSKRRVGIAGRSPSTVALIVAAAIVVPVAAWQAFAWSPTPPDSGYRPRVVTPSSPEPEQPTVATAATRLFDGGEPVTLLILGDSTGAVPGRWPFLLGERIGAETGRPVTIATWDAAALDYGEPVTLSTGSGAELTIWNASAAGMNARYNVDHWPAMRRPADLAIINHGHNSSPEFVITDMRDLLQRLIDGGIPVAVTVQNEQRGPDADRHARVLGLIRDWAGVNRLPTIDVQAAFGAETPRLLLDDRHPNERGNAVWADAVSGFLEDQSAM